MEPLQPAKDILTAELSVLGFESFQEHEKGIIAYIPKNVWYPEILKDVYFLNSGELSISYTKKEIPATNWNWEWEKNFDPVEIAETVSIRAPFHPAGKLTYNILIEPKMSFGTGHHETTHLMIQHLLQIDVKGKSVLDMGCGTAILSILAEMKKAHSIDAIDIDPWGYANAIENVERNRCTKINVYQGDASLLFNKNYDIVIANINRNVLLRDISLYARCLNGNGILLLSGFYQNDLPLIEAEAKKQRLQKDRVLERNRWVGVRYFKNAP